MSGIRVVYIFFLTNYPIENKTFAILINLDITMYSKSMDSYFDIC